VRYKLVAEAVREYVSDRTRVIAIIDPLNPLGSAYTEDEIEALCTLAEERGIHVVHDCTYRDFAGGRHCP
ncbi:MAG: aminotransferase class I/II-fold pyridoxal phosphate-dependent enzyme, partial [Gammaproteobacteria bacterium]|nr:aminotransferase class I/II-fold pyridoxal phosphate-dependent enzyme [Gammaproteobacteria bacterium]NIR83907.1 aminotransferase class I/II-fold pyridoxal phosphate-dependent enzyme [Gammaproteobacteria bacterium]NIU05272.1 aminotransferase class I/II-fold pyridoxal phosphate-dependent enzyme [Gammaproteobacteria bacterium]NIX86545.1 aminotransferase class I/II-fold pyridoxal phosphate-dependent enzyme [Gammaproteobacteria bacterium]